MAPAGDATMPDSAVRRRRRNDRSTPTEQRGSSLIAIAQRTVRAPEASAFCDTRYPGGICTIRCTSNGACHGLGLCFGYDSPGNFECRPSCTSTTPTSCDEFGAACTSPDGGPSLACVPTCVAASTASPITGAAYPTCVAGTTCDVIQGVCLATPLPAGPNPIGAPCTSDSGLRSTEYCQTEIGPGGSTGYLGGYCMGEGIMPSDDQYVANQPMPAGSCPPEAWLQLGQPAGALTGCVASCVTASDCRPGYTCSYDQPNAGGSTSTGACAPVDCSMAGMSCPSGYACVTSSQGGICAPGAADAGTDTDAASSDATTSTDGSPG